MPPLNESSHHHGDMGRMRQMVCGASATPGPNRDAGGKQRRHHCGVRGTDSTSAQKWELGQWPCVLRERLADGTGLDA